MIPFSKITQENILSIKPYIDAQPFRVCDYTIGAIFQWRAYFRSAFAVVSDMLVMLADYGADGHGYIFPVGNGDLDGALTRLERDAQLSDRPLVYCAVPDKGVEILTARYGARCTVEKRRDWADYLYNVDDLIDFPGKRYHTQRNHYNRFLREYPDAHFVPVTPETLPAAVTFLHNYEAYAPVDKVIEAEEMLRAEELLAVSLSLGLSAGYVVANDTVVALAVGEAVGDTLYVHVEKARVDYAGAYQAIVSMYADYARTPETKFINREDDSGDEGLRYSKLAYRPVELLDKSWVTVAPD